MAREVTPSSEENKQPSIFNYERMTGEQLAGIVGALGAVILANEDLGSPKPKSPLWLKAEALTQTIARDLQALPDRLPGHAHTFFAVLTADENPWPRLVALNDLAGPVLKAYANDPAVSRSVAERCLELLDDPDDLVRGAARDNLSQAVCSGWIEEPLLTYVDEKLPDDWRRDDL